MVYLNYGAKKEMKMRIKFLYFVEFHERSFPSIHLCTLQSTCGIKSTAPQFLKLSKVSRGIPFSI